MVEGIRKAKSNHSPNKAWTSADIPHSWKMKVIEPYLYISYLETIGQFKILLPDEDEKVVIKFLSDLLISFALKGRKRKRVPPELKEHLQKAKLEIAEIFSAVKMIGFSGYLPDAEMKWQTAALERFDNNRKGFSIIKRDFFQDRTVYQFRPGHEKGDFEGKILQKVISEKGFKKIGIKSLRDFLKGGKPTQN